VLDNDTVLQPSEKVVKIFDETDYNRRFEALESQICELKSFLLLNESDHLHENKKEDKLEWARRNSNPRPPPCEDGGFWAFCGVFCA
jgi:hypothetical protein